MPLRSGQSGGGSCFSLMSFSESYFRLAIRVTFQVIFLGGFRVTFQVIQKDVILENVPSLQWESYTVIWAVLSWGLRG